jgi:hypothetical protein
MNVWEGRKGAERAKKNEEAEKAYPSASSGKWHVAQSAHVQQT